MRTWCAKVRLVGACALVASTQGWAAAAEPKTPVERVQEQMRLFAAWQPPVPSVWTIDETTYPTMDQAELAALRERVKGRPEHPDRGLLEEAERQAVKGGAVERSVIYFGSEQRLRFDRIRDGRTVGISVLTPTEEWYTSGSDAVIVRADGEPIPGRSVRHIRKSARDLAAAFVFGPVAMAPPMGATIEAAADGEAVIFTVAERGIAMRLEFASPNDRVGRSIGILRADGMRTLVGERQEAVARANLPEPAVVGEIRSLTPAGRLSRVQRLVGIDRSVPANAFALPMEGPSIATGGELDVTRVQDLRDGEPGVAMVRQADGWQTVDQAGQPIAGTRRGLGLGVLIVGTLAGFAVIGAIWVYRKAGR